METQIKINPTTRQYDLSIRLYKITEFIQKVAVMRNVSVVLIREELCSVCKISKSLLSQLERAIKGDEKSRRLQVIQEMRMNAYFRKHLKNDEIFVMQMELPLA